VKSVEAATVLARNLPISGPSDRGGGKRPKNKSFRSENPVVAAQPTPAAVASQPTPPSSVQSSPRVAQLPVTGAVQVGLWEGATRRPSSDRRCLSRSRGRFCLRPCPCLSRPIISVENISSPRIAAAPVPAARRRRERRLSTALRARARRPPPAAAVCEYAMPVLRI
jgi:hypothetical protein